MESEIPNKNDNVPQSLDEYIHTLVFTYLYFSTFWV